MCQGIKGVALVKEERSPMQMFLVTFTGRSIQTLSESPVMKRRQRFKEHVDSCMCESVRVYVCELIIRPLHNRKTPK